MATIEVELLTDQGNNAVVRFPGRKYPGVVIQGDTLSGLIAATTEAIVALDRGERDEAREVLRALAMQLQETQERYETAVRAHGIERPY